MRADDITAITAGVTKKWAKQRKREERDARARDNRAHMYSARVYHTDVAHKILPKAYATVSANGRLPASQRQLFYASREQFHQLTGRQLDYKYFAQALLRTYLQRHETFDWKVTRDARGTLIEPHTDKNVPVGTLQIDRYLAECGTRAYAGVDLEFETDFPTCGPGNRYQGILYIEKEGFNPLFREVKLAERFDIAIMSCKGQSVIAARKLVDQLCHRDGVPLLVLHDFDKYGFEIRHNLTEVSSEAEEAGRVAYEFENEIDVIDLGLRLEDVREWKLQPESCRFTGDFGWDLDITEEEKEYLREGQRVELNAFTSADFVKFVEGRLRESGIEEKYIPDDDTLGEAYRRAHLIVLINAIVEESREDAEQKADALQLPDKLREQLAEALKSEPEKSWDQALYEIVERQVEEGDA